jgi:uncharacterized protein YxjI
MGEYPAGMSNVDTPAADWYPDPFGRHEHRYWDGTAWTSNVSSHGKQSTDEPVGEAKTVQGVQSEAKIAKQLGKAGVAGGAVSGAALLDQLVLVVNQKAKLLEVNSEYAIFDGDGTQIGMIRQVGQSKLKKAMRVLTSYDQYMTHKFQIVDAAGNIVLAVTRPAKFMKSKVLINDGAGASVGEIVQENMFGKIRFGMFAGGTKVGSLNAENWRAWDFSIKDGNEVEVARVTKTWEGLAKTMFTTADNYVVQVHAPLADPLRLMVIAAALTVDTALKQDQRGLG